MSVYNILRALVRLVLLVLLAFVVLWINSQLPGPLQLDQTSIFGAVVLLAILWYLVDLIIALLFANRTLPPK